LPTAGTQDDGTSGSTSAGSNVTEPTGVDEPRLDVAFDTDGDTDPDQPPSSCKVVDDMDAVGDCRMYHVTNVREDARIPQFEQPSWQLLNTYRTNAQIEDGGVCNPDPEG
jgi:hypothetical protein